MLLVGSRQWKVKQCGVVLIQQQEQFAAGQEQGVTPEIETSAPQMGLGLGASEPSMGRGPEMRSGINFGPGRSSRIPDQGSPEYEQLIQRVRGLGQMRR
jgi:hypothetical protein